MTSSRGGRAKAIVERGPLFPFQQVAPYMQGADIVLADLEAPMTDRYKPPFTGVEFLGPASSVEGLKSMGVNVVTLGNNHSTNHGTAAFTDTLDLLEANGIKYVGGGRDIYQARAPLVMEVKGLRVAFLDYNAVAGSTNATETMPGVAWIDLPPYGNYSQAYVSLVQEAVKAAGQQADMVIVGFHWGVEYVPPSEDMINLAHATCDAGADLIIGSHPHCPQPFECYGGSFIVYNLGNFVFDQTWAEYTREGFIARMALQGDQLTGVEFIPYLINAPCVHPLPGKRWAISRRQASGCPATDDNGRRKASRALMPW